MNQDRLKSFCLKGICSLLVMLVASLSSFAQENIRVENTSQYLKDGLFSWKMYILPDANLLKKISSVEYRLDPSYRDPVRKVDKVGDARYPFAVSGEALKPFKVGITVYVENESPRYRDYTLQLIREIAVTKQIRIRQNTTEVLTQTQFQKKVSISVGSIYAKSRNKTFPIKIYENSSNRILKEAVLASGNVYLTFNYDGQEYALKGYTKAIASGFDYLYCTIHRIIR